MYEPIPSNTMISVLVRIAAAPRTRARCVEVRCGEVRTTRCDATRRDAPRRSKLGTLDRGVGTLSSRRLHLHLHLYLRLRYHRFPRRFCHLSLPILSPSLPLISVLFAELLQKSPKFSLPQFLSSPTAWITSAGSFCVLPYPGAATYIVCDGTNLIPADRVLGDSVLFI